MDQRILKELLNTPINIANVNEGNIPVMFVTEPYNPILPVLPITTLPTADENYFIEVRDLGKKSIKDFENDLEENQCKGKCGNVHVKSLIKEWKAYIEILKAMDEGKFDLVVMGASGRHSTLDRITLGSVTEMVIRESKFRVW